MKVDKEKIERLRIALELIQSDFDEMTAGDRNDFLLKLAALGIVEYFELANALIELKYDYGLKPQQIAKGTKPLWLTIKKNHLVIKEFLLWFFENFKEGLYLEFQISKILLKGASYGLFDRPTGGPTTPDPFVTVKIIQPLVPGKKRKIIKEVELPQEIIVFVNLLDGIPTDRIKKCVNKKCNKLFVQTSKREKRFCSTRCQHTAAVRALRQRKSKKGD
jgi:hypothetical protein